MQGAVLCTNAIHTLWERTPTRQNARGWAQAKGQMHPYLYREDGPYGGAGEVLLDDGLDHLGHAGGGGRAAAAQRLVVEPAAALQRDGTLKT